MDAKSIFVSCLFDCEASPRCESVVKVVGHVVCRWVSTCLFTFGVRMRLKSQTWASELSLCLLTVNEELVARDDPLKIKQLSAFNWSDINKLQASRNYLIPVYTSCSRPEMIQLPRLNCRSYSYPGINQFLYINKLMLESSRNYPLPCINND